MGAVSMPLKIVRNRDEKQEAFPHKVTLTGERAAKVLRQASYFPEHESLVVPEWDGKFDLFQVHSRGTEIFCTESPLRDHFLNTLYRYPTALVVEVQWGSAKSAPREALDKSLEYIFTHCDDFKPLCGDMDNSEGVGHGLAALAYRVSGSIQPKFTEPVTAFKELDQEGVFFYLSQSNPEIWEYLYDRWLQGKIMIDGDVDIPESLRKRLQEVKPEIRIAGSDPKVVAYVNY